jgi:hypothetical protein
MGFFWQTGGDGRGMPLGHAAEEPADSEVLAGDVLAAGLLAGTLIATEAGWRPVETVRPRDLVLTFDAGAQPIVAIEHVSRATPDLSGLPHLWPLEVPLGALGNRRHPLRLLPEQLVLIEADAAERRYGDPFVLVPALALDGLNGIGRDLPRRVTDVVVPKFEDDQTVYCNGGALLHCPAAGSALDRMMATPAGPTPRLSFGDAAALVAELGPEACIAA